MNFAHRKHYGDFVDLFTLFSHATYIGVSNAVEITEALYGKYHIENEVYYNSKPEARENLFEYFKKVVIPHKIAVSKAGNEFFKNGIVNKYLPSIYDQSAFVANLREHDISKFSAAEATGYFNYDRATGKGKDEFEAAWHHHKNHNPHHPEYWFNPNRGGYNEPIPMPALYVLEMICDWIGAGKTYGSTLEEWLPKNISKFRFGPSMDIVQDVLLDLGIETIQGTDINSPVLNFVGIIKKEKV